MSNGRDLIHDRKNSDKTSDHFKNAGIKLCDYFIRIRKESLLVPIIRILRFMVPGAKLAVYRPGPGSNQATLQNMEQNYLAILQEIEKEITLVEREASSMGAKNIIDQQRSRLALSSMYRSNVALPRALSTFRSLITVDTAATSLSKDVQNSNILNGDVVILRSTGLFSTIDSASDLISLNMLGETSSINLGTTFP
jgi:hypothetical protein